MSQKPRVPNAGSFKKGVSGNPGGNPKGLIADIRATFGGDVRGLIQVLVDLALGRVPTGYENAEIKTADRIKANAEALDRIIGKSPQSIEGSMSVGMSPDQAAILVAVQLTPHERRKRLAEIEAEDDAALDGD